MFAAANFFARRYASDQDELSVFAFASSSAVLSARCDVILAAPGCLTSVSLKASLRVRAGCLRADLTG